MNEDPLGFEAGVNFYTYVSNNPINFNDPSGKIVLIDDAVAWGGIKLAEYMVQGISWIAGSPVSEDQFNQMDSALMTIWKGIATPTPYVVGSVLGPNGAWVTQGLINKMAGTSMHEYDIPGIGQSGTFNAIINGMDILNPTPISEVSNTTYNLDYLNDLSTNNSSVQASGGFVLYPNKPNTNMMSTVYEKR